MGMCWSQDDRCLSWCFQSARDFSGDEGWRDCVQTGNTMQNSALRVSTFRDLAACEPYHHDDGSDFLAFLGVEHWEKSARRRLLKEHCGLIIGRGRHCALASLVVMAMLHAACRGMPGSSWRGLSTVHQAIGKTSKTARTKLCMRRAWRESQLLFL
jgi:hypothetical protein